ncbi:MAG: amidophosphoribosyltransferase [Marinilabiliaceae bacterium]|jgi:amidophosphoribosyltransferase|nr:amidophosphoribosyltransferase [Marinilabiliaceae bacterium]
MSDRIKHECGIAMVRLLKPLDYYIDKYGSWDYGLQKMYLLLEKQHNRGQDGAGIAGIKLGIDPGNRYIFRERSNSSNPIRDVFDSVYSSADAALKNNPYYDFAFVRDKLPFSCNVYIGHVRYGTFGNYNIDYVHPVSRENNWRSRNLVLAGNFNLTNVSEIFQDLVKIGQNPVDFSDTVTILENVGHFLDEEVESLFRQYRSEGLSKQEISPLIENNISVADIISRASKKWDGGYAMAGMLGHGDAFVVRDPWGIRPAFYYQDDEVLVVASERPVIQTVFNLKTTQVNELEPGNAIIARMNGDVNITEVRAPGDIKKCSFERIYFSRGTDKSIYRERKKLGEQLTGKILAAVNHDIEHTVFSYIPNTAESAFFGLIEGLENYLNNNKMDLILKSKDKIGRDDLDKIMSLRPRIEKLAVKDAKLRTFITEDKSRDDLVGHVYDVTYGIVERGVDNMVVIDDSIVRGTTLKKSIIRILDRLDPKKIVIVSSSPQIRYPDCYGIDMAKMGDFIAFRAAIELLKQSGREDRIREIYNMAQKEVKKPVDRIRNVVKEIYEPFTADEISAQISRMLKLPTINAEVKIVYQSIEGLHKACPDHKGDWYFTGNYPTPGGNKVVNRSFINFIEGRNERAY